MTEQCGCGCGEEITCLDPDPFFKRYPCQRLWMWSRTLPEGEQATRRAEMRYFHELWMCEPWSQIVEFHPTASLDMLRGVANGVLQDIDADFRLFNWDEMEDVMRVLVYRYWRLTNHPGFLRMHDLVPSWVLVERDPTDYWKRQAAAATAPVFA